MHTRVTRTIRNVGAPVLIAAGLLILAGWQFRIPALKGEMLGTFVAPLTALFFMLSGVSVLLQWTRKAWVRSIGFVVGALVGLGGAALLFEHATGLGTGIDWFFAHRFDDWYVDAPPGRIALPTSIAFFFAGIALVGLRWRRAGHAGELASAAVTAVAYLAVVGYVFNISYLYGRVMALPTALLLIVLAMTLFAASNTARLTSVVFSPDAGGIALRRIAPLVVIMLPLIGWFRLQAQAQDLVSLEQGVALHTLILAVLFGWVSWTTALALNRLDTERKQAHAALVRSEKLVATGRLAASVAHEINNPLESVLNLLFLSRSAPDLPPNVAAWLETADAELLRVAQITRQTLGFYRGGSGVAPVPLGPTIAEIIQLYAHRAAEKKAVLRQGIADGAVLSDAGEVRQVIGNLVANALDAVSGDGSGAVAVTVREKNERHIEIRVTDNGSGIAPEHFSRLFEPFFTTKQLRGTGLGLFVTKQLVEKNGGTLELVSQQAGDGGPSGTTAIVTYRRAPSANATAGKAS